MPNYKLNDPKGWCGDPKRGAAMGRPDIHGDPDFVGRLTLRKVRLSGDYDANGTYWGYVRGEDLYWCASEDCALDYCLRARSREEARAAVLARYPQATVRR